MFTSSHHGCFSAYLRAALSATFLFSSVVPVWAQSRSLARASFLKKTSTPLPWRKALPLEAAQVSDVQFPSSYGPESPVVILIRDIHQNVQAQTSIAATLRFLARENQGPSPLLVGVEGAQGEFALKPYLNFPDPIWRDQLAQGFLEKKLLTGAECVAMTLKAGTWGLALRGIENPALYAAHVQALRSAFDRGKGAARLLRELHKRVELKKSVSPNRALVQFFEKTERYQEGQLSLKEYACEFAGLRQTSSQEAQWLNILALGNEINLPALAKERSDAARSLQLGNLSSANLDAYPNLERTLRLQQLLAAQNLEDFSGAIESLKKTKLKSLATAPQDRDLAQLLNDLAMFKKLTGLILSPEDWRNFVAAKERIYQLGENLGLPLARESLAAILRPFENFNQAALARNEVLVANLLRQMDRSMIHRRTAVLIAGGFHTQGLVALLKSKGAAVVTLTPVIKKLEGNGNEYLNSFRGNATQLQTMFTGQNSALPVRPALDLGNQDPLSRIVEGGFTVLAAARLKSMGWQDEQISHWAHQAGFRYVRDVSAQTNSVRANEFDVHLINEKEESLEFRVRSFDRENTPEAAQIAGWQELFRVAGGEAHYVVYARTHEMSAKAAVILNRAKHYFATHSGLLGKYVGGLCQEGWKSAEENIFLQGAWISARMALAMSRGVRGRPLRKLLHIYAEESAKLFALAHDKDWRDQLLVWVEQGLLHFAPLPIPNLPVSNLYALGQKMSLPYLDGSADPDLSSTLTHWIYNDVQPYFHGSQRAVILGVMRKTLFPLIQKLWSPAWHYFNWVGQPALSPHSFRRDLLPPANHFLKRQFFTVPKRAPLPEAEDSPQVITPKRVFKMSDRDHSAWRNISNRINWYQAWMIYVANLKKYELIKIGGHQSAASSSLQIMIAVHMHAKRGVDHVFDKPHAAPVLHSINYILGKLPGGRRTMDRLRENRVLPAVNPQVIERLQSISLEERQGFEKLTREMEAKMPEHMRKNSQEIGLHSYPGMVDPDKVDDPTGSVGMGAASAIMQALKTKFLIAQGHNVANPMFYVVLGDGEANEGQVLEALHVASEYNLKNVAFILDFNRQTLDKKAPNGTYRRLIQTYLANGWDVIDLKWGRMSQSEFAKRGGDKLKKALDSLNEEEFQTLLAKPGQVRSILLSRVGAEKEKIKLSRFLESYTDEKLYEIVSDLGGHDLEELNAALDWSKTSATKPT